MSCHFCFQKYPWLKHFPPPTTSSVIWVPSFRDRWHSHCGCFLTLFSCSHLAALQTISGLTSRVPLLRPKSGHSKSASGFPFHSDEKLKDLTAVLIALQDLRLSLLITLPVTPSIKGPPRSIPTTPNSRGLFGVQPALGQGSGTRYFSCLQPFPFSSLAHSLSSLRVLLKWHVIWEHFFVTSSWQMVPMLPYIHLFILIAIWHNSF